MTNLKGIAVTLYTTASTQVDSFGAPIEVETAATVNNVLIGQPTAQEITDSTNLYGKKVVYVLGIPKGDQNEWENKKISFFGKTFRSFGAVTEGIEDLMPLPWNKKVMVEAYG